MDKILPAKLITFHSPDGSIVRAPAFDFGDLLSTRQSPDELSRTIQDDYSKLIRELKRITTKRKLSKDDWARFGQLVANFEEGIRDDFGVEIINLTQALAEDLAIDENTVEAYKIYYRARTQGKGLSEGKPKEMIIETLKQSKKPMTPRQISAACSINYNTVRRLVRELLRDGKIGKAHRRGFYTIK